MQMLFFLSKKLIIHVESGIDPNCKVILEVTFLTKYSYNYLFLKIKVWDYFRGKLNLV